MELKKQKDASPERRTYRIHEVMKIFGVSRSLLYKQISAGKLKVTKFGRATLFSREALDNWQKSAERIQRVR